VPPCFAGYFGVRGEVITAGTALWWVQKSEHGCALRPAQCSPMRELLVYPRWPERLFLRPRFGQAQALERPRHRQEL